MISLFFVFSILENIYGCCDGYGWDVVENDCVGKLIVLVILNKN